jgi:hypothetical protein
MVKYKHGFIWTEVRYMGLYVVCPFYLSDSRASISCEDCIRQFSSKAEKRAYIRRYCEDMDGWKMCPYAIEMNAIYEEAERMGLNEEQTELRRYRHLAEARGKENESLRLQFAHLNAKIKSLEMLCGYLADVAFGLSESGEEKIPVKKMAEFFGRFEVDWEKTDGEYIFVRKRSKNGK